MNRKLATWGRCHLNKGAHVEKSEGMGVCFCGAGMPVKNRVAIKFAEREAKIAYAKTIGNKKKP